MNSNCCKAPKTSSCSDEGTCSDICSKCKKPFIPELICRKCGITLGQGKPKGLSERVEKKGTCELCGQKGSLIPPQFYNL